MRIRLKGDMYESVWDIWHLLTAGCRRGRRSSRCDVGTNSRICFPPPYILIRIHSSPPVTLYHTPCSQQPQASSQKHRISLHILSTRHSPPRPPRPQTSPQLPHRHRPLLPLPAIKNRSTSVSGESHPQHTKQQAKKSLYGYSRSERWKVSRPELGLAGWEGRNGF